jgi:hypothetical protein
MSCENTIRPEYIGRSSRCYGERIPAKFYGRFEVENSHFYLQPFAVMPVTSISKKLNRTAVTLFHDSLYLEPVTG